MIGSRLFLGMAATLVFCASLACSLAADQKSTKPTSKDIEALRQSIEDQSKQIEALTQQIAHLTELIEAHGSAPAAASSPSPTPENIPVPTPETVQVAPENPGTHSVAKGETLTSIAKHYKITVGELQKVNKIENDRTLQIGQVLIIPSPTPSPTPEEKKEQ